MITLRPANINQIVQLEKCRVFSVLPDEVTERKNSKKKVTKWFIKVTTN